MFARFSSRESRGLIQVSRSGAMPWRSSHRQVSMAVLPAPTITYWSRAPYLGRSFGGMQSTSGRNVIRRRSHRGHGDTHEGRVDDPARGDVYVVTADVRIRPSPRYSLIREVRDLPRRQQLLLHDRVEVGADLAPPAIAEAVFNPVLSIVSRPVAASSRRSTPRVGVAARRDRRWSSGRRAGGCGRRRPTCGGLGDQGVDERHRRGTRPDDQVVGFDGRQSAALPRAMLSVPRR